MMKLITNKNRIRHKLIIINLFTTGVALLLAGAALITSEFVSLRDSQLRSLTAQAKILANNSTAPLTFNDRKAAAETLSAMKASPSIDRAVIYDTDGGIFAEYRGAIDEIGPPPAPPREDKYFFDHAHLFIFQDIVLDKERIGTVYLKYDLENFYSLMMRSGVVAAAIIAIVFGISFALLSGLQKMITEPILNLSQLMRFVSQEKNYSLKAVVHSEDEIGSLAKGFNEMLEQIQARDAKLQIEVHERRRAEEEVRKLNDALELKVRKKTAQLLDAQKELVRSEKLSMLGLIAGGMGNELRNPLGVMNNAVFFLKSVMTDADETVREYLDIIKQEIDNSEGIISGLLDFYRIQRPRIEPTPVHELIKQGLERCSLPENVKLRSDIPDMPLIINIDRLQMARVLQNLITNAVQAMPEGGALRISARSVRKRGSLPTGQAGAEAQKQETSELPNFRASSLDGDFIEISVTDTGEGIAPEDMEKLFQPLFTTKSRGIGLGLAYSRKLTEANGGRIEVESEEKKGTTFTIILPVGRA